MHNILPAISCIARHRHEKHSHWLSCPVLQRDDGPCFKESSSHHSFLQACNKYHEAWQLQNSSHAALYNWGVALSDMAHLGTRTEDAAAYHCVLTVADKYALSLFYHAITHKFVLPPPHLGLSVRYLAYVWLTASALTANQNVLIGPKTHHVAL